MSRRIKRRKSQQFRERRRRFNAAREELRSMMQAEILKLLRDEAKAAILRYQDKGAQARAAA
jgi:hypothetical protein